MCVCLFQKEKRRKQSHTGKSSSIDYSPGVEVVSVAQGVSQNQTTLSVSVIDLSENRQGFLTNMFCDLCSSGQSYGTSRTMYLDGFAVLRLYYVSWFVSFSARHVLTERRQTLKKIQQTFL